MVSVSILRPPPPRSWCRPGSVLRYRCRRAGRRFRPLPCWCVGAHQSAGGDQRRSLRRRRWCRRPRPAASRPTARRRHFGVIGLGGRDGNDELRGFAGHRTRSAGNDHVADSVIRHRHCTDGMHVSGGAGDSHPVLAPLKVSAEPGATSAWKVAGSPKNTSWAAGTRAGPTTVSEAARLVSSRSHWSRRRQTDPTVRSRHR